MTKTKVRECQHIGMSGGFGLCACDLCNQREVLREVKGIGWVDPEA